MSPLLTHKRTRQVPLWPGRNFPECNCAVVWTFFSIAFLWDWNVNWPFPVLWSCRVFQISWHIECSTLTTSSFRTWNNSAEIPPPPLALFIVMLPKATSDSRMSLDECSHHRDYLGHEDLFWYSSSVFSCRLFLISSASVRSLLFLSFTFFFVFYCLSLNKMFPW